jgi:hypothetical protein
MPVAACLFLLACERWIKSAEKQRDITLKNATSVSSCISAALISVNSFEFFFFATNPSNL